MNNWKQKYDAKKQYPRHPQAHRLGIKIHHFRGNSYELIR